MWAGDHKIPITAYGEVDLQVSNTFGGKKVLRLYNVALCEGIACNLVSLRRLHERGMHWDNSGDPTYLRRMTDQSVVCVLQARHDQFVIEHIPEDLSRAAFFTRRNRFNSYTKRKPRSVSAEIWHLRMGHPGPGALERLVNTAQGVRIKGIKIVECSVYARAKIKRQVKREPKDKPQRPGDCFAIDFHNWEPDDKKYDSLMLVTDRYIGISWDFYTTDRKYVTLIAILEAFFKELRVQHKVVPKVIESDNELKSAEFTDFFRRHGLVWKPSAPRTQGQNGAAERAGALVKQKALALALGAAFPNKLWREISRTAVYLLNRQPRAQNDWKTPYQAWYSFFNGYTLPYSGHLRVFGCKAYAMTDRAQNKEERLKRFEPKAWIGYLIGYTATNIYRVWVPSKNAVIVTRDVIFDENTIFDGKLETLAQDVREMDPTALANHLEALTVREPDIEEVVATPGDQEDVRDITNILEDDDGVIEDKIVAYREVPEPHGSHTAGGKGSGSLPTPPQSPPAAMLAGAITLYGPGADLGETRAAKLSMTAECGPGADPGKTRAAKLSIQEHWNGSFHAGTLSSRVGTLGRKTLTRAQVERLLKTPLSIHRRDLPDPPGHHGDLKDHPMGNLFEDAERAHLQSHIEMRS